MTNKEIFTAFCEELEIDVEYLTYDDLVRNEGQDGIEDFTGKEVYPGQAVYWFPDREPLFYLVNQSEDLTSKDIEFMLLYYSNSDSFYGKDIFREYAKFASSLKKDLWGR